MAQEKHTHRGLIEKKGTTIDNYIQLLLLTQHYNDITVISQCHTLTVTSTLT